MNGPTTSEDADISARETVAPGACTVATQADRDEITRDSLGVTAAIVGAIYLFLGISHIFFVPPPHNLPLAVAAIATSFFFGLITLLSYRSQVPVTAANPVLFAAALVVLSNASLHIYLTDDLMQATNLALILIGWGLFVLSLPWFIMFFCCTAIAWLVLQQAVTYDAQILTHYTFMLLSAAGISAATFIARFKTYNRVIAYRKHDLQVQESLRQAMARGFEADVAEERNDAKDTFIAHLSHELRTPLNAVVGFAQTMKMETMGPIGNPKYLEYVQDITDAGNHLTSILEDLHDLVLVEKGQLKVTLATFDVPKVLESCMSLVEHRANSKNILVQSECEPALAFVSSDKQRFRQIFVNLLTNAIKYTPEGGTVLFQASICDDGRLLFEVIDNGVGMGSEELKKAVSPFWRAGPDMSVGDVEGSGLGLAITTQLVELLGGTFELKSEKGAGTTARVWLPQSCRAYELPSATSFAQDWRA